MRLFGLRQTASTFADWQAAQFGSDKTNAALAGPLTDLDKDGSTLTVQAADTLTGPWLDLASSSAGNPFAPITVGTTILETTTGTLRSVEVRDLYLLTDPAHPRRFMRLQLTQP